MPPMLAGEYSGVYPGTVFRYRDGDITPAPEYDWVRAQDDSSSICFKDTDRNVYRTMASYSVRSVFACSPTLPIVVSQGDPMMDTTYMPPTDCDCPHPQGNIWRTLKFVHDKNNPISHVDADDRGVNFTLGKSALWIPALVPKMFANSRPAAAQVPAESHCLSGDIGVVLGLMCFHAPPTQASEIFARGYWRRHKWHGPSHAPRYCELMFI